MRETLGAAVVVVAGGSGTRFGSVANKAYLPLAGRPVLAWSLDWIAEVEQVCRIVLVTRAADIEAAGNMLRNRADRFPVQVTTGGATRHASEQAGLDLLAGPVAAGEIDVIAIHDAARPLAGSALLRTVLDAARADGGAIPVLPDPGLMPAGTFVPAPSGAVLGRAQTPQAFRAAPLVEAYADATGAGFTGTDTAMTVERFGALRIRAVPGHQRNIKITYAVDLDRAARWATAPPTKP